MIASHVFKLSSASGQNVRAVVQFHPMISMDRCVPVFLITMRFIDRDLAVTQWNPELLDKIEPV
ncbi:MAG: hypothetical protein RJA81_1935 [Planctomycetota bacterium]|jgi:hypothetical protein